MSELTRCNRCTLNDIYRRHPDAQIELRRNKDEMGWWGVYVDEQRVASFLELTPKCAC